MVSCDPVGWPRQATLKDFRHLFASALANPGVPEACQQYLLGQTPSRTAITAYTHLNGVREQYLAAVDTEMAYGAETQSRCE